VEEGAWFGGTLSETLVKKHPHKERDNAATEAWKNERVIVVAGLW
jgi:hypothetical protein